MLLGYLVRRLTRLSNVKIVVIHGNHKKQSQINEVAFLCKELFYCSGRRVVILFPRLDICILQNTAL